MQRAKILLVSVLVAFAQGTNFSLFPNWQSSWIQGGSVAAPGEFPYVVPVKEHMRTLQTCGGSIINNWYILTAGHCVFGFREKASELTVVAGTNKLKSGGQSHTVSRVIVHPGFRVGTQANDVALLRLREPVVYSSTVQPIALPHQDETTAPGTECIFSGWGDVYESVATNNLRKLQLHIISNKECKKHNKHMEDSKICAAAGPGKRLRNGDSGGPLVCGGKQIGIFRSSQRIRGTSDYISICMLASKYIDWIKANSV